MSQMTANCGNTKEAFRGLWVRVIGMIAMYLKDA